jgi:cell division protein FtsW
MNKRQPQPKAAAGTLPPVDKYLFWVVLGLGAIGVVAVYSAIGFLAHTKAGGNVTGLMLRHLVHLGLGIAAMLTFSRIDYHTVARFGKVGLMIGTGLLVLVQLVGVTLGGAERALQIGSLMFQPAELTKVALLVYIAVLLARKQLYIESFGRAFTPLFAWIILTVVLIGMEDLSTASLVLGTMVLMCFVARVRVVQLIGLGIVTVALATVFLLSSPARMYRLEEFLGMRLQSDGTEQTDDIAVEQSYQSRQALIAFALGGVTGQGPGKSTQRDFLPAPYNDFIFAIIAEEYGMIGAIALLFLFLVLLFRGYLRVARHAPDPLGLFLAVGLTTMVALYGFVHAGVSCGLLPVTGLPMPFVSYGGTSILANGAMMGILLNISRQAKD